MIERLTSELTVGSIMVPWPDVAYVEADGNCREAKAAAVSLMNRHHYSGVPLVCSRCRRRSAT